MNLTLDEMAVLENATRTHETTLRRGAWGLHRMGDEQGADRYFHEAQKTRAIGDRLRDQLRAKRRMAEMVR